MRAVVSGCAAWKSFVSQALITMSEIAATEPALPAASMRVCHMVLSA
jgi:hypothetical protein